MTCAIAVFAKTIGLSSVKTRLAKDIGRQKAEAFYRLSKACVAAVVLEAERRSEGAISPVWALAEENGPAYQTDPKIPALWTGEGELGVRLANVSEALFKRNDMVMMIGTDSPQLSAERLMMALDCLQHNREACVAGPALDGGFYLFGSARPVPRQIWESVRYSCDTTLAELEDLLGHAGRKVVRLQGEQDVDVVADLIRLQASLEQNQQHLLKPQLDLLEWLYSAELSEHGP